MPCVQQLLRAVDTGRRPSEGASRCGCRCSWAPASWAISRCAVEPPVWLGAMRAVRWWLSSSLLRDHYLRPVPRAIALAAAAIGFASAQLATARAPPPVVLPTHATIVTGTVRAVEALPDGRRVTLEACGLTVARRCGAGCVCGCATTTNRRSAHRRHDAGAGAAAAAGAAGLSGRLGSAARRLVQRPGRVGLCAWARSSGSRGRARPGRSRLVQRLREVIARPHLRGRRRAPPARSRHPADRHHQRHSAAGPRRVPRLRPGASAGGRRAAYRHRHGLGAGVRARLPSPRSEHASLHWPTKQLAALARWRPAAATCC